MPKATRRALKRQGVQLGSGIAIGLARPIDGGTADFGPRPRLIRAEPNEGFIIARGKRGVRFGMADERTSVTPVIAARGDDFVMRAPVVAVRSGGGRPQRPRGVSAGGPAPGPIVTAFRLDADGARVTDADPGRKFTLRGLDMRVTRAGARAFNRALGARVLRPGMRFATVRVELRRLLVVTGGTSTLTLAPDVMEALSRAGTALRPYQDTRLVAPATLQMPVESGSLLATNFSTLYGDDERDLALGRGFLLTKGGDPQADIEAGRFITYQYSYVSVWFERFWDGSYVNALQGTGTPFAHLADVVVSPVPVTEGSLSIEATMLNGWLLGSFTTPPLTEFAPIGRVRLDLSVR